MPATKTFTAQLAAVALVAEALGPVPWRDADWERLPDVVEELLGEPAPAEQGGGGARRRRRAHRRRPRLPDVRGARGSAEAARGHGRARRGLVRGGLPPRPGDGRPRRHPAAGGERRRACRGGRGGAGRAAGAIGHAACCGWRTRPERACPTRAAYRSRSARCRRRSARSSSRWRSRCGAGIDPDEPPGLGKVTATRCTRPDDREGRPASAAPDAAERLDPANERPHDPQLLVQARSDAPAPPAAAHPDRPARAAAPAPPTPPAPRPPATLRSPRGSAPPRPSSARCRPACRREGAPRRRGSARAGRPAPTRGRRASRPRSRR